MRNALSRKTWILAGIAILGGCMRAESSPARPTRSAPAPNPASTDSTSTAQVDRAVRITVELDLTVPHRDAALDRLREAVKEAGGYVASGTIQGSSDSGSASFEVRVPAKGIGSFRSAVEKLGEVWLDDEKAEDVTEARADINARLHTARAEEDRLLGILANGTGNLADVLAVERELAAVRERVERMDAEQRVLESQIEYATVKIRFDTAAPVGKETGVGEELAAAARRGLRTAKDFAVGATILLLSLGPTALITLAFGVLGWMGIRRLRQRVRRVPAAS
jgi:hypothetical protein